jgi:TolB protein
MKQLAFAALALIAASPLAAQDTTRVPTGVELIGRYSTGKKPLVAVRPAEGAAATAAEQVGAIIQRDLQYSNRFEIGAVPAQLASGVVDYRAWNSLNVVYLIAPVITPSADDGYQLRVDVHDIVYGTLKGSSTHQLPSATSPNFRLAVHAASDEVVRLLTGQPGIAATRIAFSRRAGRGYELVTVDYDGENIQRVLSSEGMIYSPTWSPDGGKLAYGVRAPSAKVELHERDMASGRVRVISARPEFSYAPAYSPDGRKLAFSVSVGSLLSEINEYDLVNSCCIKRLSRSVRNDLSPSYSADGGRIAFNSDRLGQLHIYVMPAGGGEATLISPYTHGEPGYYAAPDWSPTSDDVVFAGRSRGEYQIMIAKASRPGVAQQLTSSGRNEDPSWAPDGRHIVFTGVGREGSGLYVIDSQTGSIRRLVAGSRLQMADWSPVLMRSSSTPTGN